MLKQENTYMPQGHTEFVHTLQVRKAAATPCRRLHSCFKDSTCSCKLMRSSFMMIWHSQPARKTAVKQHTYMNT